MLPGWSYYAAIGLTAVLLIQLELFLDHTDFNREWVSSVMKVAECHFRVYSQEINQSYNMDTWKRNTYSSILKKQTAVRKMMKVNIFQLFLKKFQLHFESSDSPKVKICLITKHQAMETYTEVEVQFHHCWTLH